MSRWFRHYAGMMRDEKLVRVAVKAKQPIERVVWIWGAILESAAEINDEGRFEFDAGEAAYFLRADEADLCSVVAALETLGRVCANRVVKWSDRQFQSDAAAERQKRYRERRKATGDGLRSVTRDVTPPSRDGAVTAQETETETYKKGTPDGVPQKRAARLPNDWVLPAEWRDEAIAAGMSPQQADASAKRMHNWSLSDKNGAKLDWLATWRNWFDRELQQQRKATGPPKKTTLASMWRDEGRKLGILDDPANPANRRLETSLGRGQNQGDDPVRTIAGTTG